MLWDSAPANVALAEDAFERIRPVVACLEAQDVTLNGDESGDEIIQLAAVAVETAGKHGEMDPAADCLGSAGWFG